MALSEASRFFPYPIERVFALIADIERYPQFVPGYLEARILERRQDYLKVEQQVGLGPLRQCFSSVALVKAPYHLHIQSQDGPFLSLNVDWRLEREASGCRVHLALAVTLRATPLQQLARGLLPFSAHQQLNCFLERARERLASKPRGPHG